MKLKQFDILSDDVSRRTTLLISSQLVVDFDNVSQLVGQVVLLKKKKRNGLIICCNDCGQMLDFLFNSLKTSLLYFTWLRAEPCMTTAGLTASGGTGNTVTIIHSGLENLGSMPKMTSSSSEMRLKISCTRSGLSRIFFSCESSLTCFHSAYSSRPERLIRGW